MRISLRKPLPLAFISALIAVLTLSPFNIPPAPKAEAKASKIVAVIQLSAPIPRLQTLLELQPKLQPKQQLKRQSVKRTPKASKAYARSRLASRGWQSQWGCLEELWTRESNWRPNAYNSTAVWSNGQEFHAGGIPQKLGLNPSTSVEEQVEQGLRYIKNRYATPCSAMSFWRQNFFY